MSVDSVSRKHDRIPFIRFLGVYLLFQWRRQCARLHRARIALYSRRFGQWIQLRAAVSADQSAPPSVAAVVPASATQTPTNTRCILLIDTVPPRPDRDSGSLRCHHLMHLMVCMGYNVVLHCQERMPSAAEIMALRAIGVTTTAVAGGFPSWLLTNPERYCAVVVCRYHLGLSWLPLLRTFVPDSLCILDTVDLHHLREQREAELRNLSGLRAAAAITRCHELHAISCADLVWVVSPVERDYLARLLPQARVEVVPNMHDMVETIPPFVSRHGFLFVGGSRHPPNVDAVRWLLSEIFPRIRERLPDAQLHLVGAGLAEAIQSQQMICPGVSFHGHVPQMAPLLHACRVSLAPLRFGAGVKGKISEALAYGLPVVTTPEGAEGMYLRSGMDALISRDAEDLARQAVCAHEDLEVWQRLSDNGQQIIKQHFSLHSTRAALAAMLPH
ncbi:glycosyltransferase [Xylella fastidiosa]|uniref:glycosyltransferase n=1 Tax=Xylella fastidiosa TaxID=2371 RepID=UPI0003F79713|nr:glycosyltransferase [Xylella fastidiosa]MCO5545553.1 glycosyl transferase group 1 [Xylella fastidiosa]MDC7969920.1 glycosyltransferase [Xylella fastidiosa subsp. multiplex]WDF06714.1 glycosyltransferase [Xylella fastidiosa subsp. multiplex]